MRHFHGRRSLAALQIAALTALLVVVPGAPNALAAYPCSVPAKDGANVSFSGGIPNTYWAGSGSVSAGSTTITLGTRNTGGGTQLLNTGDMVLIIQMQGATFDSTNASTYGSGSGGAGTKTTVAGAYEFAAVRSATNADTGSTITIASAAGGGLVHSYTTAAAQTAASATSSGNYTWQIIRVPQYGNFAVTGNLLTTPWNGSSGGVIALDIAGTLTLSKPIDADGYGFRGGAQEIATGQLNTTYDNTAFDYAYTPAATGVSGPYVREDGYKGEGIAGTPTKVYQSGASAATTTGTQYPGGNKARGAPGNAGGGSAENLSETAQGGKNYQGTSGSYFAYNNGGAGGGNGGAGGSGGFGYDNSNPTDYGASTMFTSTTGVSTQAIGGAAYTPSLTSGIIMGGGGGAGGNNDGTVSGDNGGSPQVVQLQPGLSGGATFTSTTATASSGASGGGIIFIRVGTVTGGTLSAQGIAAPSPDYDGGGGGGAGGTIVIVGTAVSGVTALAQGGQGACATGGCGENGSLYPTLEHGVGGGGGGGAVIYSGTVTATVTGGGPGLTAPSDTTANLKFGSNASGTGTAYGATAGANGVTSSATLASVVGIRSGAECASLLLAKRITLVNGASPAPAPTYVPDGFTDANSGQVIDANPAWPLTGGNPSIFGIGVTSPPATVAYPAAAKPGGSLEYTIYFLSAGGSAAKFTTSGANATGICDFLPPSTTIAINAYGTGKPMQTVIGFASPTTTQYGTVTAQGQTGYYPINPANGSPTVPLPTSCGSVPSATISGTTVYSSGMIFFSQATIAPFVSADGGYGKVQFQVTIN